MKKLLAPFVALVLVIMLLIVTPVQAATVKMIGDISGIHAGVAKGYARFQQFAATSSGTVSEFHYFCNSYGKVRAAILADNGTNGPGNLLAQTNEQLGPGWSTTNTIPFTTNANIVSGTKYWLAAQEDGVYSDYVLCGHSTTGGTGFVLAITYPYTWVSNPTGLSTNTRQLDYEGWGTALKGRTYGTIIK